MVDKSTVTVPLCSGDDNERDKMKFLLLVKYLRLLDAEHDALGCFSWRWATAEVGEIEIDIGTLKGATIRTAAAEWFGVTRFERPLSSIHAARASTAVHLITVELLWPSHRLQTKSVFRRPGTKRKRVHDYYNTC